jgi:uncharacterized RDD family membrane protein YckC
VLIGAIPYAIGLVLLAGSGANSSTSSSAYAPEPSSADASLALAGLGLVLVGGLLMLGIWLWNRVFTMGRTGQSVGKRAMRLYLVSERTGNPMGAGMCFIRELLHYVDGIMYLGYLWPLWDPRRQTFADKVVSTVVAQAPRPQI